MAVSDGHGSARSFRSARGSAFAVEVGATVLRGLLADGIDQWALAGVKHVAEDRLPKAVERAWREAVEADVAARPFTEEELTRLDQKAGQGARAKAMDDPAVAYGATLLSVLVTRAFILYLQLGDGDILTVAEDGTTSRPLPRDERLIANETTSLCLRDGWKDVVVRVAPLSERAPALVLLSTDGYANSFADEASFLQIGGDYLTMIRSRGIDAVRRELKRILGEASRAGSGDDITLGLIKRAEEQDLDTTRRRFAGLESQVTAIAAAHAADREGVAGSVAAIAADVAAAAARLDAVGAGLDAMKAQDLQDLQQRDRAIEALRGRVDALQRVVVMLAVLYGVAIVILVALILSRPR